MDLKISVRNVRAIEQAEIDVSGITVLSGINGCGKSTISRFLYELLYGALRYNELVDADKTFQLHSLNQSIFSAVTNLSGIIPDAERIKISDAIVRSDRTSQENTKALLDLAVQSLETVLTEKRKPFSDSQKARLNSAVSILSSAIQAGGKAYFVEDSASRIFRDVKTFVDKISEDSVKTKSARSVSVFQKFWSKKFSRELDPDTFNVLENGIPICDAKRNVVALPDSVKNVFYIDSPMAYGENRSERDYWLNLNRALRPTGELSSYFESGDPSEGILGGSFEWNEDRSDIFYTQPDGTRFSLFQDGATGLKSFTIVQGLYRNGLVNEKTLLIMDEPEAHLHPQWIVRFARFLVLLRKKTGCTLLVSSHSTDFVSAVKYISEKELNAAPKFYLAEQKHPDKFLYSYRFVEDDIEPIFNTFNKAFGLENLFAGAGEEDAKEV